MKKNFIGLAFVIVVISFLGITVNLIKQKDDIKQIIEFDSMLKGTGAIEAKSVVIDGVPCILSYIDNYEKRPVMIVQHGLTSKKEDLKDLAVTYAKEGYLAISIDAAAHGELKNKEIWTIPKMIQETSRNFDTILSFCLRSDYVDTKRIGMTGVSLGGLAILHYMANGSFNPKMAIVICATPDFSDLAQAPIKNRCVKNGEYFEEKDEIAIEAIEKELRQISPFDSVLQDEDTLLYLLCGAEDEVVPYEGNVRLVNEKNSEGDIVIRIKEGQGHSVTEDDLWEILSYVVAHL